MRKAIDIASSYKFVYNYDAAYAHKYSKIKSNPFSNVLKYASNMYYIFFIKGEFSDFSTKTIKNDLVETYNQIYKGELESHATQEYISYFKMVHPTIAGPISINNSKIFKYNINFDTISPISSEGSAQIALQYQFSQNTFYAVFERHFGESKQNKWKMSQIQG